MKPDHAVPPLWRGLWIGAALPLLLVGAVHAEVVFEQSQISPTGSAGSSNIVAAGVAETEDTGLEVDEASKMVTLRAKWGAFILAFPETTLDQVGARITVQLTATFDHMDTSARGLRLALANIPDPAGLFANAIPSLDDSRFGGTTAYAWNFRALGINDQKSEIFRRSPEETNLLSPQNGELLGFSTARLDLTPGLASNLTLTAERTGPDEISLSYDFEGQASLSVVDSTAGNMTFNSFVLFLSSNTPPATVKMENLRISFDSPK